MNEVKIPVGRSGFADIRENHYYYIDKSGLIEELLRTDATQATLITRPRRFGKTLGMKMLREFFDIQRDSRELLAGLAVSENREHGEGRSDIIVKDYAGDRAAVFEVKYSKAQKTLEQDCEKALLQIDEKQYAADLEDNYARITCYGISFFKKRCLIRKKS